MQILPAGFEPAVTRRRTTLFHTTVGWIYIALSVLFSCLYIIQLDPATVNDMWWSNYTSTQHQALLVDIFNTILSTQPAGTFNLLSPRATIAKQYRSYSTTTGIYPTYPRRLVMTELTSITYAIKNLRVLSPQESVWIGTQYCWVDLARQFEVALTERRQARCNRLYQTNGAMYMEAILRNIVWDDFMSYYGQSDGPFSVAILRWLEQIPDGQHWIASTSSARQTTTIDNEVAYWHANAITDFTLQWQNDYITGISEVFAIENALGMRQEVILNNIPTVECTWTSFILYFALLNDLKVHQVANRSLIRSANNSVMQDPVFDVEFEVVGISDENQGILPTILLLRTSIGPFLCIDSWLVAVPTLALELYRRFHDHFQTSLETNAALHQMVQGIPALTLSPTPPSWNDPNLLFIGGNPMCLLGSPQPFVQQTFGFYDICERQMPLTVDFTAPSALFAWTAMRGDVDADVVCELMAEPPDVCHHVMGNVLAASHHLGAIYNSSAPVEPVVDEIRRANPGIMQFSMDVDGGNWTMLFQPLVDNSSFAFVGWNYVYDWIEGKREVVRFEGDAGTMALVSMPETLVLFSSSTTYATDATRTIFYMVVYTTFLIVVLGLWTILKSVPTAKSASKFSNFMWFNQVVGSVWIGRPLLALRGCTAVLLLSSTQLELWSAFADRSRFVMVPRSWFTVVVIAGEATWMSYVATDILTIATRRFTRVFAPLSYATSWLALAALEYYAPVQPVAILDRSCTAQDLDQTLKCLSGVIHVGSLTRVWMIMVIQVVCMCGASVAGRIYQSYRGRPEVRVGFERHMMGVADNFYSLDNSRTSKECFSSHDAASWLMVGLVQLPLSKNIFLDVKLWLLNKRMPTGTIRVLTSLPTIKLSHDDQPWYANCVPAFLRRHERRIFGALGVVNAICSILGSISYLQVSAVNLANDLLWATFNMTGAHAFTANWLNEQLVLGLQYSQVTMDIESISDDEPYDQANGYVSSAPNVGALLQYTELNTIDDTIAGLRTTDACAVPWIFTQYCYVDFGQRWELANTDARQERCKSMASNGAVFLESVLRNVDFAAFQRCWGAAFDVAIANELRQSTDGRNWLSMVSSTGKPSVAVERDYWQAHGVRHFTTQWQNFKTIGLVNEYSVSNVYGIAYPLSLETSFSAFRLDRESTLKFYWALANDFAAVAPFNASDVAGASLVRSSATFAYANTSIESQLSLRGTLATPLPASFGIVQSLLGPFGSVDMYHVPCPRELKHVVRHIVSALRQSFTRNIRAQQRYFDILDGMFLLQPAPKSWLDLNFYSVGGSILCPEGGAKSIDSGIQALTSLTKQCYFLPIAASLPFVRKVSVAATVLSEMLTATNDTIDATCGVVQLDPACVQLVSTSISFVNTYMIPHLGSDVANMTATARAMILDLNIELYQYGTLDVDTEVQLHRAPLLAPSPDEFAFFSWIFLVDWALGLREVVTFAGDVANITLITENELPQKQQVNRAQFPVNFAVYLRSAVWYITSTFLFIAVLLLVYVVLCR
ncbi:hypothetical protein DYB32_008410, partial [Aphanomyces invadans]